MSEIAVYNKILRVRENEKNAAQTAYNRSMDRFEEKAKQLYTLLRKKEEAEGSHQKITHEPITIERLKEQSAYMEQLNKQINLLQQQVIMARNDMETKQQKLSEAYVEVKKFEKLIENRKQTELQKIKTEEAKWMDEISMQQYLLTKSGE